MREYKDHRSHEDYTPHWIYRYRKLLPFVAGVAVMFISAGFFNPRGFDAKIAKAQHTDAAKKGACNIKGNVSYNNDRKIYHVPGQRDYNKTKISSHRGERWFCSEAEARANGWRKAGR